MGGSLSVFLSLLSALPVVTLYAPNGTELISSSTSTLDYDALLSGFVVSETGTYSLGISATALPRNYSLVVTRGADLGGTAGGEAESPGANKTVTSDAAYPWFNPIQPVDVNNDGYVSPRDALLLINSLNAEGSRSLPKERSGKPRTVLRVNRDGFISPIDALQVINYLNNPSTGEAAVLPSGDPAAVLPMTAQHLRRHRQSRQMSHQRHRRPVCSRTIVPSAGERIRRPAAGAAVDASINVDLLHDPHQDWILGALEPAIGALADDLAGKSDSLDNLPSNCSTPTAADTRGLICDPPKFTTPKDVIGQSSWRCLQLIRSKTPRRVRRREKG